jgi:hypothetical protein
MDNSIINNIKMVANENSFAQISDMLILIGGQFEFHAGRLYQVS